MFCSHYYDGDIKNKNLNNIMHTHIPWIHKFSTKTVECEISHKDTDIHKIFAV